MRYLSVCSGIEAASVAWHPLGWEPVAFAEIEKFPGAVLKHHYPDVPNWGDMTRFKEWPDAAIDVLVGGTPCQSFSVAGLRKGLADPRGNLCLTFLAIADRYRPQWLLWENVPGVLSSDGGRDFGSFLGGLGQLGYGWSYRVLDAQYVRVDGFSRAVPQRRRRVFVVGYLGDYRRAAAVLFERESLQGHPAPRRQAGQGSAATVAPSLVSSGRGVERTGETRGEDPVVAVAETAPTLDATMGRKWGSNQWVNQGHAIVTMSSGQANAEINEDLGPTLSCLHEAPIVAHTLTGTMSDSSEDGTGRGTPLVPVSFRHNASFAEHGVNVCGTLNSENQHAIAFNGRMDPVNGPVPDAIDTDPLTTCVAVQGSMIGRHDEAGPAGSGHDTSGAMFSLTKTDIHAVASNWAVRRLTPRECERLQGFPDDYTLVPVRGKPAADGPRYKALGNSMAVNVIRWIGKRIQMVEDMGRG